MTRIPLVNPAEASPRTKAILNGVAARRGRVPNMISALANSPAALAGYTSFHAALAGGELSAELRERIAIAVAEANGCRTCLAAHTQFGRVEGIPDHELEAARTGRSDDSRSAAALRFALAVMRSIGHVADDDIVTVRSAGFSDGEIMEIVANVFVNVFTNAVNHVAETEPDWPPPAPLTVTA